MNGAAAGGAGQAFGERFAAYARETGEQLGRAIGGERGLYAVVVEAMRYAALGGGKRLRGALCLRFCEEGCGEFRRALPFAAAVELIHAYSLIHDDLPCMDDDDLRRGRPACHIRYGEANALLAGDALLTLAFESALRDCNFAAVGYENAVRALRMLATAAGADGMVGGQVVDLSLENAPDVDGNMLREMHALKTGALIRAACGMGAVVGGMDRTGVELSLRYADDIGLAFQIADDILDVTSTPEELGKSIGKDRASGKATYVTLYGVEQSRRLARECVERARETLRALGAAEGFLFELAGWIIGRGH